MSEQQAEIIGVGSPLVDMLLEVEDLFLEEHVSGAKGGMEMVDADVIESLLEAHGEDPMRVAGGAASNTVVGCANLGINAAFVGSCGADDYGEFYTKSLTLQRCDPRLIEHASLPTGRVLCLITPDAERTMRTCLGAAAALDPAAITADLFRGAKVVMLEGYTCFNHDLTLAVAKAAKEAGCELALDLASFEVVQINRDFLDQIVDEYVDIVFANEDEAQAWNKDGLDAALRDLASKVKIAVVKLGADGSWVMSGDERYECTAHSVEHVVDTTGAGDNWAAGFLSGYIRGVPLDVCADLGAQAGAAVVQITGAQVPRDEWLRIRGFLEAQA